MTSQCEPAPQSIVQSPLEQSTAHVELGAQAVWQWPFEHAMLQTAPVGHDVLQCPSEHATAQLSAAAQNVSQSPALQVDVHGLESHVSSQWPLGQSHASPLHVIGVSGPASGAVG